MTRSRTPSISAVATTTACVFLVILIFLAAQLRAGHDPGLGTAALPVAAQQAPAPAHGSQQRAARDQVVRRRLSA